MCLQDGAITSSLLTSALCLISTSSFVSNIDPVGGCLTENGATAFESVVHMGEETQNAKSAVPFALFWSTVTNAFMGLVMIITFAVSMKDNQMH